MAFDVLSGFAKDLIQQRGARGSNLTSLVFMIRIGCEVLGSGIEGVVVAEAEAVGRGDVLIGVFESDDWVSQAEKLFEVETRAVGKDQAPLAPNCFLLVLARLADGLCRLSAECG